MEQILYTQITVAPQLSEIGLTEIRIKWNGSEVITSLAQNCLLAEQQDTDTLPCDRQGWTLNNTDCPIIIPPLYPLLPSLKCTMVAFVYTLNFLYTPILVRLFLNVHGLTKKIVNENNSPLFFNRSFPVNQLFSRLSVHFQQFST